MTLQMAYDEKYREGWKLAFSRALNEALNKALQHLPVVCFPPVNIRILKFLKLPDFPWNKFRL